jgi:uncharacterized protein (DUF1501 family)
MPRRAKTLVTIFLRGGADGLNMVVPYGDPDYLRLRPTLGLASPADGGCLDVDGFFGLHPAFAPLDAERAAGRLALVHAVGSDDETRSHFEAQDQMEHGCSFGESVGGGWVGRYLRAGGMGGSLAAVAVGTHVPEALRGAPTAATMTRLEDLEIRGVDGVRDEVVGALGALYGGASMLDLAGRDTLTLMRKAGELAQQPVRAGVEYPTGSFGEGLRDVARLVKADVGLRVACLDLGAWDTHYVQALALEGRIGELAGGLAAFQQDLGEKKHEVVVVVMTEFGRRAYENASFGTDHGRGGALLVLGDGLVTDHVLGRWPGLADGKLEGPGDLAVITDYRDVLGEVVGLTGDVDGREVFPGYRPKPVGLVA